uniref:Uncharacterized protein n=1 Tax=Glossina pallidipes TaxID=7398 RepID=A0A1B0A3E7_GLOPL
MSTKSQMAQIAPQPPPKPHKTYANGNANGTLANGGTINNNSSSNTAQYLLTSTDNNVSSYAKQKLNGRSPCHTPPSTEREQVVMTPKGKTANSTVILIERKLVDEINDRVHVAGGDHTGIIINKDTVKGQKSQTEPAQLSLEFRVFLVSANTGKHSQESRTLRFWFRDWLRNEENQAHVAQDFFKELVSPKDFPRDYVGFIKKIMKLLQKGYDEIQCLEIELRILEETSEPPTRPLSMDESQFESPPLTPEKVLELIEQAYPNPITPEDLANVDKFVFILGESNVYTLGNIGAHRIVSTKLPSVGSTREAMTATGNTTTRLLGTFQKVDYVFVVGVAGGVPHYTDYKKHVRLGDVVISYVDKQRALDNSSGKPYVYIYKTGEDVKTYFPINDSLQQIAEGLQANMEVKRPWETYLKEGLKMLMQKTESDFNRPAANTDKLFMNIGNNEVIEVSHPIGADSVDDVPKTRLHLGPIGSGRDLVRNDSLRLEFAKKYGLLATDVEMSSVLDSIIGNCRESFILVKGISDYKDGTTTRKWQNFASLAAASVVKSIICGMDAPTNV